MSKIDFDYLDITTVTAIIDLKGFIRIIPAFFLIEVNRIEISPEVTAKKKFKLPEMDGPGKVISLTTKFSDGKCVVRGINKSDNFKNAVTMDVSVTGKNINLKIHGTHIHMCGVKSREMAAEAGDIVINKLLKAQQMLEYIRSHYDEMTSTLEWIKENTKGREEYVEEDTSKIVEKDKIQPFTPEMIDYLKMVAKAEMEAKIEMESQENIGNDSGPVLMIVGDIDTSTNVVSVPEPEINPNLVGYVPSDNERGWVAVEKVNYITLPKEFVDQGYYATYSERPTDTYPGSHRSVYDSPGIDGTIANFLLDQAFDFNRHDLYCAHLDWISSLDQVVEGQVEVSNIKTSMVNYNYDLGFHVKRSEFSDRINGVCGFVTIYENTFDHSVKVQLPYEIPEELADKVKLKCKPKHTFMIYKCGKITQSGSCTELAKDAYILFERVVDSIRSHIEEYNDEVIDLTIPTLENVLGK